MLFGSPIYSVRVIKQAPLIWTICGSQFQTLCYTFGSSAPPNVACNLTLQPSPAPLGNWRCKGICCDFTPFSELRNMLWSVSSLPPTVCRLGCCRGPALLICVPLLPFYELGSWWHEGNYVVKATKEYHTIVSSWYQHLCIHGHFNSRK